MIGGDGVQGDPWFSTARVKRAAVRTIATESSNDWNQMVVVGPNAGFLGCRRVSKDVAAMSLNILCIPVGQNSEFIGNPKFGFTLSSPHLMAPWPSGPGAAAGGKTHIHRNLACQQLVFEYKGDAAL